MHCLTASMDFDSDSYSLLLERVKTYLLSLVPTVHREHLSILKDVQFPSPSDFLRDSVSSILSVLQRLLPAFGKILARDIPSVRDDITVYMAPHPVRYINSQNVLKSWYHAVQAAFHRIARASHWAWSAVSNFFKPCIHAVQAAFHWVARTPHRMWTAVSNFFKAMGHGIAAVAGTIVGITKTFLWFTLMVILIVIALGIVINTAPLVFRFCKRVQASIREEREQAERQRLLEDFERQAAERAKMRDEARRKWAEEEEAARKERAREEEEARRSKEREEAQKQVQERLRKWREQQEFQRCFETWQADAEAFFRNMETAQHFPEPRLDKCDVCRARELSSQAVFEVKICQHNLEKLLRAAGNYEDVLRRQRRMWHPDKLSRVGDSVREAMIRKATAMSQMIGALWDKERPA